MARELHRATVMLSELQLAETDLADAIEMSVPEVRSVSYQQLALTEDDCRRAHSAFAVLRKRRQAIPEPIRLGHNEYMRRKQATYRAKWAAARSSTTPDTP